MPEPPPFPASVTVVPAADVTAPPIDTGSMVHQAFPLRQPEEEANEILVRVRGSILRRVRKRLSSLVVYGTPWPEVLLGTATLLLGATFGGLGSGLPWAAIVSGVAVPNPRAVVFYVVFPVLGVGAVVGYFLLRHFTARSASLVAQEALEELPDPDRTR